MVCCEHQHQNKYWTQEDISFLKGIADTVTVAIKTTQELMEKAKVEAITRAIDKSAIVSITDLQGTIIKVNEEFCKISQYTEEELIGNSHNIVNSGYHPKEFWQEMWRTISRGNVWRDEVCNESKDGEFYWVDTVINPVKDSQGKITSYLSIRNLITDQKMAQKAIELQNEKLIAKEEVLKKAYEKMKIQDAKLRENYNELQTQEEELRQNMEELQAIQEEIYKKQQQLEGFVNASSDNIYMIDTTYQIVIANKNAIDVYASYGIELKMGMYVGELFQADAYKEVEKRLARVLKGESLSMEMEYNFEDSKEYYEINYFPIKNVEEEVIFIGITSKNITLRKQQEAEIIDKNKQLIASEEELRQNMEELQATQDVLEDNNKQITKSIQYAKTIQRAILPSQKQLNMILPQSFVLYKPKDIVSGDFYWTSIHEESRKLIGVIDCTGHGVPGAFMSLIGSNILNEIINQQGLRQPNHILDALHIGIHSKLNQREGANSDGMDLTICLIEKTPTKQLKLIFAAAKQSLYIVRENELIELKGDRYSIGGNQRIMDRKFTSQEMILQKNDMVYLATDGYADQANEQRRSFSKKRFRELMVEAAPHTILEQKKLFKDSLQMHQGVTEQRDDITLLGFRVH